MKKLLLCCALCCVVPLAPIACKTAPSERTVQVQTLKVVGVTAKAGMDAATQLLKAQRITVPQWQKVALYYDTRFQPAFSLAVAAVSSDLSSVASPDLIRLGNEFAALVAQLTPQ